MKNTMPYEANKPQVGQIVTYRGETVGRVTSVEGNLCWVNYATGPAPFIWRFKDTLNVLHDWPTKRRK